eukprot:gene12359-12494_t
MEHTAKHSLISNDNSKAAEARGSSSPSAAAGSSKLKITGAPAKGGSGAGTSYRGIILRRNGKYDEAAASDGGNVSQQQQYVGPGSPIGNASVAPLPADASVISRHRVEAATGRSTPGTSCPRKGQPLIAAAAIDNLRPLHAASASAVPAADAAVPTLGKGTCTAKVKLLAAASTDREQLVSSEQGHPSQQSARAGRRAVCAGAAADDTQVTALKPTAIRAQQAYAGSQKHGGSTAKNQQQQQQQRERRQQRAVVPRTSGPGSVSHAHNTTGQMGVRMRAGRYESFLACPPFRYLYVGQFQSVAAAATARDTAMLAIYGEEAATEIGSGWLSTPADRLHITADSVAAMAFDHGKISESDSDSSDSDSLLRRKEPVQLLNYALELDQHREQQPDAVKQAEVQEFPLVMVPGCEVGQEPDSYELPTGLLDGNCTVSMLDMGQRQPKLFLFDIADNVEMTVTFMLSVNGGTASMSLWYPSTPADHPPDQLAKEFIVSQASTEAFIVIPPETLNALPGRYTLRVTGYTGNPINAVLRVYSPGKDVQLAQKDRAVMADVAKTCCQGNITDSAFCSVIAPKALADKHTWDQDLCHFAPSSCNAQGHLTQLMLPVLGMRCSTFPSKLASLPALTRLDLSGNSFSELTAEQVALALAGAPALEELSMGNTGLTGNLICAWQELPKLKVLDLSYNFLEGPLPTCLLESLQELYVPGNSLSGPLEYWPVKNNLVTLYANQQRGKGLQGPLPAAFSASSNLRFINLGGNSLTGPLPKLPQSLQLFNISNNKIVGGIGQLSKNIWVFDASSNKLSGPVPDLSVYPRLSIFVASGNPLQGSVPDLPEDMHQLELVFCNLTGPLPQQLPAAMRRLDLSDNQLSGDVSHLDASALEVLRLANNNLTGVLPASVATSPALFLVDLQGNAIHGSLPSKWTTPRMQLIVLENNALTGTLPPALASLHNLGVLRLGNNKLSGSLTEFAAVLKDPVELSAAALAAGQPRAKGYSNIFDLNLADNQLTGPVPEQLAYLGVFNPNITIVVPGNVGPENAPRLLNLAGNKLSGMWPHWLLSEVPSITAVCNCPVGVALTGDNMHLECPDGEIASRLRFTCWDGQRQQLLLDYLSSPSNSLDKIDTSSVALGDTGALAKAGPPPRKLNPGIIAGAVIGALLVVTVLGLASYCLVYKRLVKPKQATAFRKVGGNRTSGKQGSLPCHQLASVDSQD